MNMQMRFATVHFLNDYIMQMNEHRKGKKTHR